VKIILLNKDLGYGSRSQRVQGFSGVTYGVSNYDPRYLCQACEMTPEVYLRAMDDIRRALHIMLRRWYPVFVEEPLPAAVQEFARGYQAGLDNKELPEGGNFATQAGWTTAHIETGTLPELPVVGSGEIKPVISDETGNNTEENLSTIPHVPGDPEANAGSGVQPPDAAETASAAPSGTGDDLEGKSYKELRDIAIELHCFRAGMKIDAVKSAIVAARQPA
jgi:hypothetical protein